METHLADGMFSPTGSQASVISIRTRNSVTTSLNYPTLSKSDSESARRFIRKYDQYVMEVEARHRQIAPAESTEPARPVALKFCMDPEWKAEAIKETVTVYELDCVLRDSLRIDMSDRSAKSRMESLFVSYHKLLHQQGL
eukprot:IDg16133t1